MNAIYPLIICLSLCFLSGRAQVHPAVERFLGASGLRGASVSIMIGEVGVDSVVAAFDAGREVIPASVIKLVTTAAALEILGEDFRYETALLHDGEIRDSVLHGNLYIRGSGDPTLGSAYPAKSDRDEAIRAWVSAVKRKGIRRVSGAVIADESVFDTEGVSMKWLREDLGSYYGQGCYGLNVYDNRYALFLRTGEPGSRPVIVRTEPDVSPVVFRNCLTSRATASDSSYIVGLPYANERYLYGTVPANRAEYQLNGDIPDPPLFIAGYLAGRLKEAGIAVEGEATGYRLLSQAGKWERRERKVLMTTYSPPLREIVRITNHASHNLYADALLKTIGLQYRSDESIPSFERGVRVLRRHWQERGLDTSSLWMFDGSGLSPSDRTTAFFLCELLSYMAARSSVSDAFVSSIPLAGVEGTVKNLLKGSALQGKARLKSGSMSRVCSYAGYVSKGERRYAAAIIVNNFSCRRNQLTADIEALLTSLFSTL